MMQWRWVAKVTAEYKRYYSHCWGILYSFFFGLVLCLYDPPRVTRCLLAYAHDHVPKREHTIWYRRMYTIVLYIVVN